MRPLFPPRRPLAALAFACAFVGSVFAADAAPVATCSAQSPSIAPTVVELYTSEGCSSCPPAERWLSGVERRDDAIALAFHVDYWDGLGWKDRFAQHAFTQRQAASQRSSGARFAYTPQVLVDGRDTPDWSARSPADPGDRAPAPVALTLARDDGMLALTVTRSNGSSAATSGYLAVVDDGLRSRPSAGENKGAALQDDAVVRELLPWFAPAGRATTLRLTPTAPIEAGAARHWVAVALDAATGRPLQAVALRCAR